jgi:hypothetical protein
VADTGQVSQLCLTMFEIDLKKISYPSKRKFKIKLGDLRYFVNFISMRHMTLQGFFYLFSNKTPPISYKGSLFNCSCSPTKYHGVLMEDFNVDFNTTGSRAQQATNFHI